MTGRVAEIWRHPIKSHSRERIDQAEVTMGKGLPWDRRWAVAHERSCFDVDRPRWQPCNEFSIGSKSPRLQAVSCFTDPAYRSITLSHPDRPDLTIDPDDHDDANKFIQWVMPISNGGRYLPARLVRGDREMTDTDYGSISLINMASHRALEQQMGQSLSPLRWRGNLLVEGLAPWEENDWIGKFLRIGEVELEVRERIARCNATMANPETGEKDANTLAGLRDGFGHTDCGVYLVVQKGGWLKQDAEIEVFL
ncbi:MAG: MOSC domain-containing protein [Paracoccaceae bacterium]|jgi:hypothetical protein|nr:MOSC domain-containing protein [Paracoccaceae bacterium]